MEPMHFLEKRKLTWTLLFLGFCCLFGWVATNAILLTRYTNRQHFQTLETTVQTVVGSLIITSFYVILAIILFYWAIGRYRRTTLQRGLIASSLLPAALLAPLWGIAGVALIFVAPFAYAHARAWIVGPHIVQAADSPDEACRAYVVDKPSLDGPNHHLFVENTATGQSEFVTNLPEDVDYIRQILWSPHSDLVVFRTHFKLIVYSPAAGESKEVKLGGDYHWRPDGTFWVDYDDVKEPLHMRFPTPGRFVYQLEGEETSHTIDLGPTESAATAVSELPR